MIIATFFYYIKKVIALIRYHLADYSADFDKITSPAINNAVPKHVIIIAN